MEFLKRAKQWNISRRSALLLGLGLTVLCLLLAGFQQVYTWIDGAPLDDELMFGWAQSISRGEWLGEYGWLTLSKRPLFAVWLALLNFFHIPYLVGGRLLAALACFAAAEALKPCIENRAHRLLIYLALLFNPAFGAEFTLRVYRDNIYPALCLLFFAGLLGWLLRCRRGIKACLIWLVMEGLGLGLQFICREDGIWLLPAVLVGHLIGAVIVVWGHPAKRTFAELTVLLPLGLLAVCVGAVCAMNNFYYGAFVLSDFSEGGFSDAIGAMTRVKEENEIPLVSIPTEVREKLYSQVEEFGCLEYWLEQDDDLQNSFRNPVLNDYQSGSFYWAVRKAASFEGVYDTPQKAEAYWSEAAEKINTLCDEGKLSSEGKKRSGTTPPVKMKYVPETLLECLRSLKCVLLFEGCEPYSSLRSIGPDEDLAVWQNYLRTGINSAAVAGSDAPYYNTPRKAIFMLLQAIRLVYAAALSLGFAAAVFLWIKQGLSLVKEKSGEPAFWFAAAILCGMSALRIGLISYMETASFHIGTYPMYLASVHPLLILFAVAVCFYALEGKEK